MLAAEYSRMAAAYDRDAAPYHAPMVHRILELAALSPGERVLDLGCGTGNLTLEAARRVGETGISVGIDLAEGMVAFAAAKAARRGKRNVRFAEMDARTPACASHAFTAVLSCLGLMSVGHERCFAEVRRVLADAGRFVFCEWSGRESMAGPPFRDTLIRYRPANLPLELHRLLEARRVIQATGEAGAMSRPETVIENLRKAGFREARSLKASERMVYPTPDAYLARAFAWGDNEREYRLMSPEIRRAFRGEFAERARPLLTDEGLVVHVGVNYFVAAK